MAAKTETALSAEITNQSQDAIIKAYTKKTSSDRRALPAIKLLKKVNKLAAAEGIKLDAQSNKVTSTLFNSIKKNEDEKKILAKIKKLLAAEKKETMRITSANGDYSNLLVHNRCNTNDALRTEQLQENDMIHLLPNVQDTNVKIIETFHTQHAFLDMIADAIADTLRNQPEINHIFIPVGPYHWQSIYLRKATDTEDFNFKLEMFDPLGKAAAKNTMRKLASELMDKTNQKIKEGNKKAEKIPLVKLRSKKDIKFAGPEHRQRLTDGMACGDFTCAYIHQKVKALGVPETHYNQYYIDVYEKKGNANCALRLASCRISREKAGESSEYDLTQALLLETETSLFDTQSDEPQRKLKRAPVPWKQWDDMPAPRKSTRSNSKEESARDCSAFIAFAMAHPKLTSTLVGFTIALLVTALVCALTGGIGAALVPAAIKISTGISSGLLAGMGFFNYVSPEKAPASNETLDKPITTSDAGLYAAS